MADIIQQRRDTAARWSQYNPILLEGEVGYVTDNPNQYKIGNGRDRWNDLHFRGYTGTITQDTGDDENAVMSQKATTEKLAELGSNVSQFPVSDSQLVNECVKELYYSGGLSDDAISKVAIVRLSYKQGESSIRGIYLFTSSYQQIYAHIVEGVEELQPLFTDNTTRYAVIDWDRLESICGVARYKDIPCHIFDRINHIEFNPAISNYIFQNKQNQENEHINLELSEINEELDKKNTGIINSLIRFGDIDKASTLTANKNIWVIADKSVRQPRYIAGIRYKACGGNASFYLVTIQNGVATKSLLKSVSHTASEHGKLFTIYLDVVLDINQYIGISDLFYIGYSDKLINYDVYSVEDSGLSIPTHNAVLNYELLTTKVIEGTKVLLDKSFGTSADVLVLNATSGQFTSDGLRVSSNVVTYNKYYSLQEREVRYICKFAADTKACFCSSTRDSQFFVDMVSKTINVNELPKTDALFLNSEHIYLVMIGIQYNKTYMKLTDLNTSDVAEFEYVYNGVGGFGQGAVGTEENYCGSQHDYYAFYKISGGDFYIKQMQVVTSSSNIECLLYGDSITELSYYPANVKDKDWVQLLKANAQGKVISSGRGSKSIAEVLLRIKNELPFIKAHYVMLTIGTNGGVTENNLSELIEYIISCGSIPILNHIPCNINSGGISNHTSVNAIVDLVRNKYNITGVNFDIATSENLDGLEVDTNKMWHEDYGGSVGSVYHHPNVAGSLAMYNQILRDTPFIL